MDVNSEVNDGVSEVWLWGVAGSGERVLVVDRGFVDYFYAVTEDGFDARGLLPDGRLDIVGLEVMRGDWAAVAKEVQEKVLEIILKERSPQKAAEYVQGFIYDIRQKRVPYRDLIIWNRRDLQQG